MNKSCRLTGALMVAAAALAAPAHAEPAAPVLGAGCAQELSGAMTLLPDDQIYAICQQSPLGSAWVWVQGPFDPHDTWLSYGPAITLHGQGMRNPDVSSGMWSSVPQDPQTVCRAEQQTVVEAGVLAAPQVAEGRPGEDLSVQFLPKLFYLTISGHCLWSKVL